MLAFVARPPVLAEAVTSVPIAAAVAGAVAVMVALLAPLVQLARTAALLAVPVIAAFAFAGEPIAGTVVATTALLAVDAVGARSARLSTFGTRPARTTFALSREVIATSTILAVACGATLCSEFSPAVQVATRSMVT